MSKMLCMNQSHTKIYVHGNAMGLTHTIKIQDV